MARKIADLIKAGKFKLASPHLDDGQEHIWEVARGTRIRGELVLVTLHRPIFDERDAQREIDGMKFSGRAKRLEFANAYELVAYASRTDKTRWDGRSTVMALGSRMQGGVTVLSFERRVGRILEIEAVPHYWRDRRSILCVKV